MAKPMPKKQATAGGRPRRAHSTGAVEVATAAIAPAVPAADVAATTSKTIPAAPAAAGPLALGASLSIREVGERAAQFKALFAAGTAELDARLLESVDTAGLQLLLAAAAAARRRGLTLRLLGADRLNSGPAAALGLTEHLAAAAEILP